MKPHERALVNRNIVSKIMCFQRKREKNNKIDYLFERYRSINVSKVGRRRLFISNGTRTRHTARLEKKKLEKKNMDFNENDDDVN